MSGNSNDAKNCRIEFVYTDGTVVYEGKMHLENYEVSVDLGDKVQISVSMQSDGPMLPVAP